MKLFELDCYLCTSKLSVSHITCRQFGVLFTFLSTLVPTRQELLVVAAAHFTPSALSFLLCRRVSGKPIMLEALWGERRHSGSNGAYGAKQSAPTADAQVQALTERVRFHFSSTHFASFLGEQN